MPGSHIDGQQSEPVLRHSHYGSIPLSTNAVTSSIPVTASTLGVSSVQQNWPTSTSRRSLQESKWKWLHSNAMSPEQSSPLSLRRATRRDIPSTAQLSSSPFNQDLRQQSAGSLITPLSAGRQADVYYKESLGEQPQHRKTTMDLIQSVSDVHRSVGDQSVRHWRHSSDNTARRSTVDAASHKWDNYGLTLSLSGAAVPRSGHMSQDDNKKLNLELGTYNHQAAASTGDLPQKLPIERITRFDNVAHPSSYSRHPKDVAVAQPSRGSVSSTARYETQPVSASSENASMGESRRSGRMSIPDSIPIYFRAEPSTMPTQVRSSRRSEGKTASYSTDSHQQPSSITASQSASYSMYIYIGNINIFTVCSY